MTEILYSIDVAVFYFINHTISNSLFDRFFPYITEVKHWYLVYAILWLIVFIKGGRIGKIAAIGSLLLITASDQFSSKFLKYAIGRIRPCNALPDVNILAGCTSSFSFPSSHAVNNFAVAAFFGTIFKNYRAVLFTVASVVALSRPYVGVHYPSDILGGAVIGFAFGYAFAHAALKLNEYITAKYGAGKN